MDRLAGDPVADEARQAQVGEAGDDPLLACRQRHEGVGASDHVVHAQQELAVAADGERVDRRDPELLDAAAVDVVGKQVGRRDAAEDLVDVAEVAAREPEDKESCRDRGA